MPLRPTWWTAVRETHTETGGHHWHVMVYFKKGFRSRDPDAFNVRGRRPHVKFLKSERDVERVWEYLHKEEGAYHFGPWTGPIQTTPGLKGKDVWLYMQEVSHPSTLSETP